MKPIRRKSFPDAAAVPEVSFSPCNAGTSRIAITNRRTTAVKMTYQRLRRCTRNSSEKMTQVLELPRTRHLLDEYVGERGQHAFEPVDPDAGVDIALEYLSGRPSVTDPVLDRVVR